MDELGELEAHHADFEKRGVQVVVASREGAVQAKATQDQFPHLVVVADPDESLGNALSVMDPRPGPDGSPMFAPTTFLIDKKGIVRWVFRPDRFIERLSPAELLAAVDAHLGEGKGK